MSQLASPGQLRDGQLRWALVFVPGVVLLGFVSLGLAGSGAGNPWFDALTKPSTYPELRLFHLVWTLLYGLMGLAAAIVAAARGARERGRALAVFAVQLALSLIWSPLFFGYHRITAALVLIGLLDLAVIATVVLFARVRTTAALLLAPYLLWLLFATVLTWQIREANPDADGRAGAPPVQRIEL